MNVYLKVGVLTAILYPITTAIVWGISASWIIFWSESWSGILLCAYLGILTALTLVAAKQLSLRISAPKRAAFIRLFTAVSVGIFSVALLNMLVHHIVGTSIFPLTVWKFLKFQLPGLLAAVPALRLVRGVIEDDTLRK